MMVILDCDTASTLAKVDRLYLLKKAFSKADIWITNSVYIELLRAKKAVFSFPDKKSSRRTIHQVKIKP
jgi:hypothetical protein